MYYVDKGSLFVSLVLGHVNLRQRMRLQRTRYDMNFCYKSK